MGSVVIVGSLSVDFVMRVPRRPVKGETISGFDFNTFVGGKGNNQALAAVRAGADVHMVGRVGRDQYGDRLNEVLKANGVSTKFLVRDEQNGTGIANIYVDPEGDNSIVIIAQANGKLSPRDVVNASSTISGASVLMLQLEVPIDTVVAAASTAKSARTNTRVMLNPAPAPPDGKLPANLYELVDIMIPNQTEAELLTGIKVKDEASAMEAAAVLQERGVRDVIITMGESGAFVIEKTASGSNKHYFVPSFKVEAVDTTAAGDAFCGALAACLADNKSMKDAVVFACAAGALAVTKAGAEPSLPKRAEIDQLLNTASQNCR